MADYIYVTSAANEGYSKTIHNNFFPLILKGTLSDEPSGPDDFEPSGERIESSSLPEPGQLEESFPYISFQFKIDRKLNLKFEQEGTSDPVKRKSIRKYRYQQKEEKDKLIKCAFIRAGPSVNKPTGNTSFS